MKIILVAALMLTIGMLAVPQTASAGQCDHSYQSARDGSSCGGRAADQRAGGR